MPAGPVAVRDFLLGLEFSHYRIVERIGSGGMGVVYRGYDTRLEREVAVKVLKPGTLADEHSRKRFRNEAQALSKLNHPNVATVHDFETHHGQDFLVMEFIQGATLTDKLAQGPLSEQEIQFLGGQLCEGLAAAHARGVVHRDLKPSNLRLTPDNRLKILDFGLAKLRQPAPDAASGTTLHSDTFAGTLPYMAPEQLSGDQIDARTDIYATGLILYEMATGQRPYAELHSSKLIGAILRQSPIPPSLLNPRVSPGLERVIGRCMEKAAENRYQSAREVANDLRQCDKPLTLGSTTVTAMPEQPRVRPAGQNKRWLILATVLVALLALVLVLRLVFPSWVSSRLAMAEIPHAKQLAVLPFAATGGDAQLAAFGAGLTETLTAKLTQLTRDPLLQVVPAPEVRDKRVTSVEAARQEFGVNLVLLGSLHKSGNQVRINCVLVDPGTRRQLRANVLTVADGDSFTAEDAVVSGAIEMLGMDASLKQTAGLEQRGTQLAGAYDYYLQGKGYLQNYDREENLDSAIQVFQRALTLDKNYALAYAGLGEAFWQKYRAQKKPQWLQQSREACRTANQLNDRLPAAHACLGVLYVGTGNYQDAAKEFEQVLQIEPTNDAAYKGLANAYEHLGKLQEAESAFKQAITLRPHYWATYNWLGAFYYRQARFTEATQMFRQVVALAPDNSRGYYNLSGALLEEARYEEAAQAGEHSIAIKPSDYGYINLGTAHFFLKRYDEAARAFEQATHYAPNDALAWLDLGDGYYFGTGRRKDSRAAYEKCAAVATQDLRVNPHNASAYGDLAYCQAMLGRKGESSKTLKSGLHWAPDDPSLLFQAALVHNQFGEHEETLRWLARARAAGFTPAKIRDCPNFEALHSQSKFQELLRDDISRND